MKRQQPDTANDRQARVYENYMACLREIWVREFDELTDLIWRGAEEQIIYRIEAMPEEAFEIINKRIEAIERHPDSDEVAPIKKDTARIKSMMASVKRNRQLEALGL